ncbi:hypothetical protein WN982_38350 [Paraburkholderia sp. IMGN_8]|uniref:hypothetical protein n=1 Tax=Paraburkholderia sp. IMGN_8 TaxID=3136564 RepID=UPI0031014327
MNRPLDLIEGALAIPEPLPFDGLPPPFGSRRRTARVAAQHAVQCEPKPVAQTEAQQAVQDAVQRRPQRAHPSPFPPGAKHVLLYKVPPQRVDSRRFDAAMAEAKRYLETGMVRPRSSRSDYVLGGAIFVGCSIALAGLLATCATRDANKASELAVTLPAVPVVSSPSVVDHSQEPIKLAQLAVEEAQTIQQSVPSVASMVPKAAAPSPVAAAPAPRSEHTQLSRRAVQQPTVQASTREAPTTRPAKAKRKVAGARMTEVHVEERLALSRTVRPATRPSVSKQPEWIARSSAGNDTFDQAALLNWASQQRAHVTTRAAVPVPGDTEWNTRMTQRRITDNPDAFQSGRGQK